MSPALENGDYIVTKKPRSYRPGSIYVVNHIDLGRIIKRLETIDHKGFIFAGDNPGSTPSSIIASVSRDRIIAEARWVITKNGVKRLRPSPLQTGHSEA